MITVTKEIQFDMAHRVPNHKSKCRNLHGHRYKVVVCAGIEELQTEGSSEGMVVDFGDIKAMMMKQIHDPYDHGAMFSRTDTWTPLWEELQARGSNVHFVDFIPTAENLAQFFYEVLTDYMGEQFWWVEWVEVHETPTSVARYIP
jgi:6-pyruvoyltetrahydropterin/6-carboxytetrahydropterin synthase